MGCKRAAALLLAALMALGLSGCGAGKDKDKEKNAGMTIQPAQLSEEEAALTELLAVEMGNYRMFDFQLGDDSGVQSMCLTACELVDGDWSTIAQDRGAFTASEGRIALTFGKMTDGVKTAVQSASGTGTNEYTPIPADDVSGMTFATSKLSGPVSIEFDQEIPLVLQVATSKSEFTTYDVAYFGMPRELAKHGYEHIYAITVTFSQKPLSELSQDAPSAEPSQAE